MYDSVDFCLNWYLFIYSDIAYFRPDSDILPTLKNDMKGSEPEWAIHPAAGLPGNVMWGSTWIHIL